MWRPITVDGQKTPPHPAFDGASQECRGGAASHPTPRGARELETRPFSRGKVKVPGHSKVFPIGMCYIWEVEGDDNFEVFKGGPIFIISERHHKAQPVFSVGLFFKKSEIFRRTIPKLARQCPANLNT